MSASSTFQLLSSISYPMTTCKKHNNLPAQQTCLSSCCCCSLSALNCSTPPLTQVALPKDFVPTPFVAAGVALLGCAAGIMVTASHNTKEYNGYKV